MVSGGLAKTREARLLSWADEIATLVSVQREELRRSRMELVAAQEVRSCKQCSGMQKPVL